MKGLAIQRTENIHILTSESNGGYETHTYYDAGFDPARAGEDDGASDAREVP